MLQSIRQLLLLVAGTLTVLLLMPRAYAADPAPPVGWSGQGQAGAVLTRGNTDTSTANARLDASDTVDAWKHMLHLGYFYGQAANLATARRVEGAWQTNYNFTSDMFVFGALNGEQDQFNGFMYQGTVSTGVGYNFFNSSDLKLSTTLGVGYRRLREEQLIKDSLGYVIDRIPGNVHEDAVGTFGLDYMQKITSTTTLIDKLQAQSNGAITTAINDFGLQVLMTDVLALGVGYSVRYNSSPPLGARTTDQIITINLVYSFNMPKKPCSCSPP
jgi:putative salt-induced outer membrane protein